MAYEESTIKVKKGYMYLVTDIPVSATIEPTIISFIPKTIRRFICTINLTAGASLTLTIRAKHTFTVAGLKYYTIYTHEFIANEMVELPAGNFHEYTIKIETDGSTTGQVSVFHEYEEDVMLI